MMSMLRVSLLEDLASGSYVYYIRTVISLSVPRNEEFPATVPSSQRKYADSKTLTATIV